LIHLPAAQWLAAAGAVLNSAAADPRGPGSRPVSPAPALLAAARQNPGLPAWLGTLPVLWARPHPSRVRRRIGDTQKRTSGTLDPIRPALRLTHTEPAIGAPATRTAKAELTIAAAHDCIQVSA
jgi:subtilisin family serine protease